ncbi:MAG: cation transporter, partial [bacterium]
MKKYTFHVSGTHCASCKILIEDILHEQDFIKNSQVNLKKETVEIETESDKNPEELAKILTDKIKKNGYTLSATKTEKSILSTQT